MSLLLDLLEQSVPRSKLRRHLWGARGIIPSIYAHGDDGHPANHCCVACFRPNNGQRITLLWAHHRRRCWRLKHISNCLVGSRACFMLTCKLAKGTDASYSLSVLTRLRLSHLCHRDI